MPSPSTGTIDPKAEITLEANPTSVEADRFRGYRAAGVNRVSLGVQSLREGPLAELGRRHTVDEAIAAVRLAQSIFPRSSFDLIYARPRQTLEDWQDELDRGAVAGPGAHLSLYQLTIEQGTRYYDLLQRRQAEDAGRGPERRFLRADAGADRARPACPPTRSPTTPARARRAVTTCIYWRYGEYVGIGPGAHGRLLIDNQRHATAAEKLPFEWQKKVAGPRPRHGHRRHPHLGRRGRRAAGDGPAPARRHRPAPLHRSSPAAASPTARSTSSRRSASSRPCPTAIIRVTDKGWPVLDAVVADLAA